MSTHEKQPTDDELNAMASVDAELAPHDRATFESRLADEPALAQEVARLRSLSLLARQSAPPEPMDHEWARLERDPIQRSSLGLGALLVLVSSTGLLGWLLYAVAVDDELEAFPKTLLLASAAGFGLWFLAVLRGRLRTRSLDPYTAIKR
jgi:anti-sigma factor RsiW